MLEKDNQLMEKLRDVPDPRKARGVRYQYCDLLLMAIYAILAGHSEATEMEYYVELNFDYFKELIGLESVPAHDTFSRILRLTNFDVLSERLSEWLINYYPDLCKKYGDKKVLHIDGKAVIASAAKSEGQKPVYLLNAMYEGESVGIKLKQVGDKENEISCLPDYLKLFNLQDTIVSMDAIGCNQTVIGAIKEGHGNYVIPVKGNQKKLAEAVDNKIQELKSRGIYEDLDKVETLSKNHGRIEKVQATLIEDTSFIYEALGQKSFYGTIAKVLVIDKTVVQKKDGKEETTFNQMKLITDMEEIGVEDLLQIRMGQWKLEMQHYLLDVQLREDGKTARKDNARINSAMLRRFCLKVRSYDEKLCGKPLNRFLMSNEHDIYRIEELLFDRAAQD